MNLGDVHFSESDGVVVARLTGEIDLSNVQNIEGAVAEAMPNHTFGLILDVSGLDYLDSAGIHLIYKLREKLRARGQSLRLVLPAESPANDALRLAGVSQHIDTTRSLEEALQQAAAEAPEAEVPDRGSV